MIDAIKTLNVTEVAKALKVSVGFVYRNKHALGSFQTCRGGRLLFLEDEIHRILRGNNAISRKERQMESTKNDKRSEANKIVQNKNRSKKMGGKTKPRLLCGAGDRHGLLDHI